MGQKIDDEKNLMNLKHQKNYHQIPRDFLNFNIEHFVKNKLHQINVSKNNENLLNYLQQKTLLEKFMSHTEIISSLKIQEMNEKSIEEIQTKKNKKLLTKINDKSLQIMRKNRSIKLRKKE